MTLWDNLCCYGYGLEARWSALGHWLRGHDLRWRENIDPWMGCMGDISCKACPDSSDGATGVLIWCRHNRAWHAVSRYVCGLLGHSERRHPLRWTGQGDVDDENMVEVEGEWYCHRCSADL